MITLLDTFPCHMFPINNLCEYVRPDHYHIQILRNHHPEFLRTFEELSASDFQTAIQKVQPLIQKIRKEKDKEIQRYGKVAQLRVKNGSMGGLMPV